MLQGSYFVALHEQQIFNTGVFFYITRSDYLVNSKQKPRKLLVFIVLPNGDLVIGFGNSTETDISDNSL